jgi:mRNA deadenylase 3'-5' endonuclease subunit Ccr4
MVIHSALAMQCLQDFAGESIPYILCGDFNFTPESSTYKLYTEGVIKPTDPTYPQLHEEDKWVPILSEAVQSSYASFLGKEPEFTNHASNYGNKFTGTLDYIFISRSISVLNVLRLYKLQEVRSTFPNRAEPSDHIMVGSVLRVPRR